MPTYQHQCPVCQKNFKSLRSEAIYCSRQCSAKTHFHKEKEFVPTKRQEINWLLKTYFDISGGKLPNGCLTDIAARVGVTREWIRQIALKEGYAPYSETVKVLRRERIKTCQQCGKEYSNNRHYYTVRSNVEGNISLINTPNIPPA